jgi:hypothetical protein
MYLREKEVKMLTRFIWLRTGYYERGNKLPASIKWRKFHDKLRDY